jgi:putative protease
MRQNKVRDYTILQQTIDELHALGTKAYLTMNIFPRNMDIKIFERVVERIADIGADAIIFSDPGTFSLIRKYLPDVRLHLSSQANTLNFEAIKFRYDLGVSRVVLARELTLKEIIQIKEQVPGMELEIFIHGAMCIAYSGRCLMGEYFSGRDGNKGEYSHVCRYKFKMKLEEERRDGKVFELGQDEDGSYLMSSKDLCTIERLEEILPVVDGLKIE